MVKVLLVLALGLAACDAYDPPPEATLKLPAAGFWDPSTPVTLTFTEPVDAATLSLAVYPDVRDQERELPPGTPPIVSGCTVQAPCGGMTMALDEAGTTLTLTQNDAFASVIGQPLVLVIARGMADLKGRTRKVDSLYYFQINPESIDQPTDIVLETGALSFVMDLQVVPLTLHMIIDLAVDPDTGRTIIIGTVAKNREKDPAYPTNYPYPAAQIPDLTSNGWSVFFLGRVTDQGDGSYFFQSDPFDVDISVANGAIPVTLTAFQVQGTITPHGGVAADCGEYPGECEGRDKGAGIVSTSGGSFGDPPNPIDAISSSWVGYGFHAAELEAFSGLPRVCRATPCDVMGPAGGDCQMTDPWRPNDIVFGDGETARVCR